MKLSLDNRKVSVPGAGKDGKNASLGPVAGPTSTMSWRRSTNAVIEYMRRAMQAFCAYATAFCHCLCPTLSSWRCTRHRWTLMWRGTPYECRSSQYSEYLWNVSFIMLFELCDKLLMAQFGHLQAIYQYSVYFVNFAMTTTFCLHDSNSTLERVQLYSWISLNCIQFLRSP